MTKQLIVVLVCATACGKKGADAPPVTKADADAVNAAVPADFKGKIEFEVGAIKDDFGHHTTTYSLILPKGWKKGFMPGSLEPADGDSFGSKTLGKTSISVGSNCDGDCKSKDWAAVVDKVFYKQYTSGEVPGKIIKDDKQKSSRTLVFQQEPKVETTTTQSGTTTSTTTATSGEKGITIITTWWTDGASQHYKCMVQLGEPAIGLAAAFEKLCAKVSVED